MTRPKSAKVFFQNSDDLNLFKKLQILKPSIPAVVANGSGVDLANFGLLPFPTKPQFGIRAQKKDKKRSPKLLK